VTNPVIYPIPGFSDPFSSLTHLGGAAVFALLGIGLLRRGWGNAARSVSLAVFVVTTVLLLSISGAYHLLCPRDVGRTVMQRLDHAAIFGLIAGTFTPVYTIFFRGPQRWAALVFVWIVATVAITLKTIFFTVVTEGLGVALYLGFGWVGLYVGTLLGLRYGVRFIAPLVWGAAAYTAGAVLEFLRWPTLLTGVIGPHELFHVLVLAGVGWHWRFMWDYAEGNVPEHRPMPAAPELEDDRLPAQHVEAELLGE
jgi:channel protein (hemolysin III family)